MNLINLTPHPIVLQTPWGERITLPPTGVVARVASTPGHVLHIEGVRVPVYGASRFGAVEGLPDPVPDSLLVVSAMVAARCAHRTDVVSPGTGPADGAIRENGNIVAVTRLISSAT